MTDDQARLDAYAKTLKLISESPVNARFYWTDRDRDRRQRMSLSDLAREVLAGKVDIATITAERREL